MAETSKPAAPRASDKPAEEPKKKRSETDQELLTMKRMAAMLDTVSEPTRARVVQWLLSKYMSGPVNALRPNCGTMPVNTPS